jgi:hypothetical protein
MSKVELLAQVMAVERAAMNLRAHIQHIEKLIGEKKRSQDELIMDRSLLPQLEAAALTMRWLKTNEEIIKEALKK